MENEYDGIEYHSDGMGREGHAAINVKVYGGISVDAGYEDYAEQAWENCVERFWEEATEAAHERGYSCVFSEGRSGGCLVPFYQTLGDGRTKFMSWPGQGGNMGYPVYPDVDQIGERSRFRAFQRTIETMLEAVPMEVAAEAVWLQEQTLEALS